MKYCGLLRSGVNFEIKILGILRCSANRYKALQITQFYKVLQNFYEILWGAMQFYKVLQTATKFCGLIRSSVDYKVDLCKIQRTMLTFYAYLTHALCNPYGPMEKYAQNGSILKFYQDVRQIAMMFCKFFSLCGLLGSPMKFCTMERSFKDNNLADFNNILWISTKYVVRIFITLFGLSRSTVNCYVNIINHAIEVFWVFTKFYGILRISKIFCRHLRNFSGFLLNFVDLYDIVWTSATLIYDVL